MGIISEVKRKTLPEIARVVGSSNEQGLLHFLTESFWEIEKLREARLKLILKVLAGREITLIIDETGDRKILTVVQTCRRQGRSVIDFFVQVLLADSLNYQSRPSLLPQY